MSRTAAKRFSEMEAASGCDDGRILDQGRNRELLNLDDSSLAGARPRESPAASAASPAFPGCATNCSTTSSNERVPSHSSSSAAALAFRGMTPPGCTSTGCADAVPAFRHSTRTWRPVSRRFLVRHNTALLPVPCPIAGRRVAGDGLVLARICAFDSFFCKVRASPETPVRTLRSSVAMAASRERDTLCHSMRHEAVHIHESCNPIDRRLPNLRAAACRDAVRLHFPIQRVTADAEMLGRMRHVAAAFLDRP